VRLTSDLLGSKGGGSKGGKRKPKKKEEKGTTKNSFEICFKTGPNLKQENYKEGRKGLEKVRSAHQPALIKDSLVGTQG